MQNNSDSSFFNLSLTICGIHGWGYGPLLWNPVAAEFAKAMPNTLFIQRNLGFFGSPSNSDCQPDFLITHSLGTLWSLKNEQQPKHGIIIINGFTDFKPFVSQDILERMKRGVLETPDKQMRSFWRQCGYIPDVDINLINKDRLIEGLDWLTNWDASAELAGLDCPVLVLAGAKDRICAIETMKKHWDGQEIAIHPEGGHALPQTHPAWCMEKIENWICRHL